MFPQILQEMLYGPSVDWWALGVLLLRDAVGTRSLWGRKWRWPLWIHPQWRDCLCVLAQRRGSEYTESCESASLYKAEWIVLDFLCLTFNMFLGCQSVRSILVNAISQERLKLFRFWWSKVKVTVTLQSIPFSWSLRNAVSEFLQIWHKLPLGLILVVKGHCDLT